MFKSLLGLEEKAFTELAGGAVVGYTGTGSPMPNITILTFYDRIAAFHTLKPFLFSKDRKLFTYTNSPDWCLQKDRNRILVMVRWFLKPDRVDLNLLKKLREKYERLVFFHDDAGGGIPRLEVLPFVDLFYQKALFKDRTLYMRELYGKELFSDYYHKKYGIRDPEERKRAVVEDPEQLKKLRLSWNIGIGDFPRSTGRERFAVALARILGMPIVKPFYHRETLSEGVLTENRGLYPVHARMGLVSRPSIAFHRKLILEKIKDDPRFITGEVGQRQYNREIRQSKIILSPFGWGELCYRDFEAVRNGALLLKPDMSHLETWPDVFKPFETYVPFSWDADDLIEKAAAYLEDEEARKRIVRNAFEAYREQLAELPRRFEGILSDILL